MDTRARLTASGTLITAAGAAALSRGCALFPKGPPPPVPVWVRSPTKAMSTYTSRATAVIPSGGAWRHRTSRWRSRVRRARPDVAAD